MSKKSKHKQKARSPKPAAAQPFETAAVATSRGPSADLGGMPRPPAPPGEREPTLSSLIDIRAHAPLGSGQEGGRLLDDGEPDEDTSLGSEPPLMGSLFDDGALDRDPLLASEPLTEPPPSIPSEPPVGGLDLGEETQSDIAPIGPTEYAGAGLSLPPPESDMNGEAPSQSAPSVGQLEQQIRDLEARLDELIDKSRPAAPKLERAPAELSAAPAGKPRAPEEPVQATAREVLSSEFYLRQWGRSGMRNRSEEVDDFGHDPAYEAKTIPFLDFLYKRYFRVEVEGIENVPAEGRCLIVANHSSGPLPYDGLMLRTTLRREHPEKRQLRWLAEDFIYYLPFAGAMMNRLGAVRACQENAERLLAQGRLVAVFPEGAKGIGKLFRERYKLQRFGRGGFIRLCLRTHTPIVPCAILGAEEANPMLYRIEYMTKTLGIPYLPITPTFPALGPLGLLPAPTKWKVSLGEPLRFDSYGPEAADDEILVGRLAERVRAIIQGTLDEARRRRRSIWFG